MSKPSRDWEGAYQEEQTPWDSGLTSAELRRILDEQPIDPCRMLEIGCGTGTNSLFLAQQGFSVTAVDLSPTAVAQARDKAAEAGVDIEFHVTDILELSVPEVPYEFIFDRGAYHCIRKDDLQGFLEFLSRVSGPGTRYLTLVGNADEDSDEGPPRLTVQDISGDLERLFAIDQLRAFYFEDPGGERGPLGWSCLMTRRDA